MSVIDRLAELHGKATQAPWHIQPHPWPPSIRRGGSDGDEIARAQSPYTAPEYRMEERHNGDLIVAMRNALPAILKVLRAAKEGPCRHSADHDGSTCPLCQAFAELEAANENRSSQQ